jgi:hypothetical protein
MQSTFLDKIEAGGNLRGRIPRVAVNISRLAPSPRFFFIKERFYGYN